MVNEKINSWTFEETVKTAENLMKNEKNIFKWDVLRHLKDFAETYQKEIQQYRTIGTVEECRAAVERNNEKTRIIDGITECCGYDFGTDAFQMELSKFCPACGRKIERSDEADA